MSEATENQILGKVERIAGIVKLSVWLISVIAVVVFWIAAVQFQVTHMSKTLDTMSSQNLSLQNDVQSLKERLIILEWQIRSGKLSSTSENGINK